MRVLWLSAVVILLDQATKVAVLQFIAPRGGMAHSIPLIGDWLRLTFTENPGMAFGITFGPPGTVTILSMLATCGVAAYIYLVRNAYAPFRWSLGLIFGGAIGNVIDRVFYGVILDYGTWFTGHVVDFIHVSLWRGFIPNAVPLIGGSYMELFPIWNVADMAIVIGVVGVLFFHRTFHERRLAEQREERSPSLSEEGEEGGVGEGDTDWSASSTTEGVPPASASLSEDEEAAGEDLEDRPVSSEEDWSFDDQSKDG
jgi:signal peptidase II